MVTHDATARASSTVPPRQRERWIDLIRGTAILLVIANHAIDVPMHIADITPGTVIDDITLYFAPFRMTSLMLLSGLLLPRALAKPPRRYYASKLRTLAWPYVVWLVIFWIATSNPTEWMRPDGWATRSWLWFILCLFLSYLAAPLLTRIPTPWFALVPTTLWLLSTVAPDGTLFDLSYYSGFFFAGYLIARTQHLLRRFDTTPVMVLLLIGSSVFAALLVLQEHGLTLTSPATPGTNDNGAIERFDLIWVPVVLAGITGTALLARRIRGTLDGHREPAPSRFLQHIGRNSVVFYLIHYPLQIVLVKLLAAAGITEQPIVMSACIIAALAVSFGAVALRRRSRVVNALFVFPQRATPVTT
ncbi:acyltransferase family protein [Pseudoclavibacter terrae]|uniref:acyltransferase family protein n=1 Tax=Pseudoclavibacter terrae TaxID=1530195 RepID=UPI00232B6D9C|nr:acyltransferase [Pseudoclavibacter terrae]